LEINGWDAAAVCAKAITYAATLGAAGAIFFLAYSGMLLQEPQRVGIRRLAGTLLLVSALASCVRVALGSASMSGEVAGMFDSGFVAMILGAGEGRAIAARIAGSCLAAAAVFSVNRRLLALAFIGALIASMSFALVGHVHALPGAAPTLLLCLHLSCASFWLGALAPLLIVARGGADSQFAAIAARFGKIALGLVALLLSAGALLLWTLIQNAALFWSSDYGRLMVLKLLSVAVLLCIAGFNRLYLTPRLLQSRGNAVHRFRRSIQIEIVLGMLILLFTAAFTTLTGPPH
jgi:putative copper resistance protein D